MEMFKTKISKIDKKKRLILPKNYSKSLAEFIGILTGDGYINYYPYYKSNVMDIAGNSEKDYDYLTDYIASLIMALFNLSPKLIKRKDQKTIHLLIYSYGLTHFLENIGFKRGKKGNISVPKWILQNKNYMNNFIKGIFDTDGNITLLKRNKNNKPYPKISITSKSGKLIDNLSSWLIKQKFSVSKYKLKEKDKRTNKIYVKYRITLYGKEQLNKWTTQIGSSNKRNLSIIETFKKF